MITVIPAMDIMDGKCVRLTKGDFSTKKVYSQNPLETALRFQDAGLKWLHLVDLDGAKKGEVVNWKTLEVLVAKTELKVQFGGGIQSHEILSKIFSLGISRAIVGSLAVKNALLFEEWLEKYGPERLVLGADAKDGMIAVNGWEKTTALSIESLLKTYLNKGLNYTICTDISKDGMLQGPALNLYKKLRKQFPELKIIASGGISSPEDIRQLEQTGIYGVVVGKAIYEGRISMEDISGLQQIKKAQ